MLNLLFKAARGTVTALQFIAFIARALSWLARVASFPLRHPLATIAIVFIAAMVIMTLSGGAPNAG